MIAYVTVGADDMKSAQRFYDSFLPSLGYALDFYVGYLRDPQGNKIAIFSSHPDDPGRGG